MSLKSKQSKTLRGILEGHCVFLHCSTIAIVIVPLHSIPCLIFSGCIPMESTRLKTRSKCWTTLTRKLPMSIQNALGPMMRTSRECLSLDIECPQCRT